MRLLLSQLIQESVCVDFSKQSLGAEIHPMHSTWPKTIGQVQGREAGQGSRAGRASVVTALVLE